jgi:opacity protein-like surface antigen
MKRILLASSALAVLASVSQAQAASDMYVSVFGGANFLADDSQVLDFPGGDTEAFSSDPDTGFVLGGAIGTTLDKWVTGLKVELEASYRRNDIGGTWTTDGPGSGGEAGFIDGNASTFAIMANAAYEVDIGSKVRPYVTAGAGWARVHYEAAFIETVLNGAPTPANYDNSTTAENSGFAWQLGLGINYEVAPDVDVGIGYRYFVGPRIEDQFLPYNSRSVHDNEDHAVHVNLTIGVN